MVKRSEVEGGIPRASGGYDVVVAGGGPAGIGAAAAAAGMGARTLLLEARGFFGGVASTSLWMPMNRLLLEGGSRGGVHDLFVARVRSHGSDASREGKRSWVDGDGLHIHPDFLRLAVFELLEEVGCAYRLYSPVTDVIKEGGRVAGVVTRSKGRRQEFRAAVTVDATGDGDVAMLAGAEMTAGGEDGRFMPVTLGFAVANVDEARLFAWLDKGREAMRAAIAQAERSGYTVSEWYSFDRTTVPGVVSVNNGGMKDVGIIDGSDPADLTISERTGISVAVDFVRWARAQGLPGLEHCVLVRTGAGVGVRETRRIVGDYVLTLEDATSGPEFTDRVARRYGAVDPGGLKTEKDLRTVMKSGHAYPYRALLPRGIDGLLVAGRCGSTTQLGQAAGKSMGNMMDLGQAAGTAAAIAARKGIAPRAVDVAEIQGRLRETGVRI